MEIQVKGIVEEDFVNYKKPSMFIAFPKCTFKCGVRLCQNSTLAQSPSFLIDTKDIVKMFMENPISKAVVIGGLEPFDNYKELKALISELREVTQEDIVIYSGYTEAELKDFRAEGMFVKLDVLKELADFGNITIKFGRYLPSPKQHYDKVLGVMLASDNQYAKLYERGKYGT